MKKPTIQTELHATAALYTLLLVTMMCGCATQKLPDYHPAAVASSMRTVRTGGMEIVLDPFVEAERTRNFFGINAAAEGIGVVFVRVSNATADHTFVVLKKNFQLVLPGADAGRNPDRQTIERPSSGGETTYAAGAAFGGLGGLAIMAAGSSMISRAEEVKRNWVVKELPDQTLPPGQSMEGFVYFRPLPKGAAWARGATVRISLTETKSHAALPMIISLSQ